MAFIGQFIAWIWLTATLAANDVNLEKQLASHEVLQAHSDVDVRITRLEVIVDDILTNGP